MKIISICLFLVMIVVQSHAAIDLTPAFKNDYEKAQNRSMSMSTRWKALLDAAQSADGEEILKIKDFAKSSDWYMRNASLVALDKAGNDLVYDQAKDLVSDKSLVVRSAAVDILSRRHNDETRKILSQELTKSYNFNQSSSLWIRPQIMKYLIEKPKKDDRDFFVKHLYDKDEKVAFYSANALEKMTQIRYTGKNSKDVINQWKTHVKTEKW